MPALPCPLGARCHDGVDGATWKTVDIDFNFAKLLLDDHVKIAHENCAKGSHCSASAKQGPVMDHGENVNTVGPGGAQGGNFVNSSIHQSTFNLNTPRGYLFGTKYQKENILGRGSFGVTWKVRLIHGIGEFAMKEITYKEEGVIHMTKSLNNQLWRTPMKCMSYVMFLSTHA